MWSDEQIKELAKKHGWWAVESWWQQAIPRFRAMLEEYAAQQSVERTVTQEEPLRDDEFSSWDDNPGYW